MSRDEILEAAAQIFSQKGFHGASMQDIAEAVNLQKASLYYHVTSKQEILVALLDQALELISAKMQCVLDQPDPPDVKLRQAMRVYLTTLLEHGDLASVLLMEHRSLEAEFRLQHIPRRDRFERMWRELIQEGVSQGMFQCKDVAMAARAVLGVMNWSIQWYRPEGRLSAEDIANQFAEMFLNGLLLRS
jgi:AcrR family transcriptional regulator